MGFDVAEKAMKPAPLQFLNPDGEVNLENYFEYLVRSTAPNRTGIITNYGTKALDVSNHLRSLIYFAKDNGCEEIVFIHPDKFIDNERAEKYGFLGCNLGAIVVQKNGVKKLYARAFVPVKKYRDKYVFGNPFVCGSYSLEEVEKKAEEMLYLDSIVRILQGREIDGAKTGVYAEGVSGNDFIEDVKVIYTPHEMLTRQKTLGREISGASMLNEYKSLSPLARIHDYVKIEVEENGRIIDDLANGVNMSAALYALLDEDEKSAFKQTWVGKDGAEKSLLKIMDERKKAYNNKLHNIMESGSSKEDIARYTARLKDDEILGLRKIAKYCGVSMEIIAVAAYTVTYNKNSKQGQGLSYGWILAAGLLSVFSRENRQMQLLRLPVTTAENVKVHDGILYINGKKQMRVNAYDSDSVPLKVIGGNICALIHRRVERVTQKTFDNVVDGKVYTIATTGFRFHIGRELNASNEELKTMWKEAVKENGFRFNVELDQDNRVVLSIGGKSISSVMLNDKSMEVCELVGQTVQIVNKKVIGGVQMDAIEETNGSICNIKIVAVQ